MTRPISQTAHRRGRYGASACAVLVAVLTVIVTCGTAAAASAPVGKGEEVTQERWARMLSDAIGWRRAGRRLAASQNDLESLLVGPTALSIRIDAASYERVLPLEGGSGGVLRQNGEVVANGKGARLVYSVSLPVLSRYRLDVHGRGRQSVQLDGVPLFEGTLRPERSPAAFGPVVVGPGRHQLQLRLEKDAALSHILLSSYAEPQVRPHEGWEWGRPLTYGVKAVTLVQVLGIEDQLPIDDSESGLASRLLIEAEDYFRSDGLVSNTNVRDFGEVSGGNWVRVVEEKVRVGYRLDLKLEGVYTILAKIRSPYPTEWYLDGSRLALLMPAPNSDRFAILPVVTQYLERGSHLIEVELRSGTGLDVIRLVRRRSDPKEYIRLLSSYDFGEGSPEQEVTLRRAFENLRNERFFAGGASVAPPPLGSTGVNQLLPPPVPPPAPEPKEPEEAPMSLGVPAINLRPAGTAPKALASLSAVRERLETGASLDVRETYDNNVFLDDGAGHDDFFTSIRPRVYAGIPIRFGHLAIEGGGDFFIFPEHDELSEEFFFASAALEVRPTNYFHFEVTDRFQAQPIELGRPDESVRNLAQVNVFQVGPSFELRRGRTVGRTGYSFSRVDFRKRDFPRKRTPEHVGHDAYFQVVRKVRPRIDVFGEMQLTSNQYDSRVQDFVSTSVRGGGTIKVGERTNVLVAYGQQFFDFESTGDRSGPTLESSVDYQITRRSHFSFGFNQGYTTDLSGETFETRTYQSGLSHRLGPRTSLGVSGFLTEFSEDDLDSDDSEFFGFSVGLDYRLYDWLKLRLEDVFAANVGDINEDDYKRNQVSLDVSMDF